MGREGGSMKAQTLVFEQVLLFGMGVMIFMVCFAAFNIYQSYFSSIGANDQLNDVKELIASNLIEISQKSELSETLIKVDIPQKIMGLTYVIELGDDGLNIFLQGTQNITKSSSLFNLGKEFELSGRISSMSSTIVIYKKQNRIIIE